MSSKGDCPALWPFLKQILGRSSSHVALIEMIGGGGVVSALCLTRAYLPGAKPGETGTGGGKEREEGEEEKKKKNRALLRSGRAAGHLSKLGLGDGRRDALAAAPQVGTAAGPRALGSLPEPRWAVPCCCVALPGVGLCGALGSRARCSPSAGCPGRAGSGRSR